MGAVIATNEAGAVGVDSPQLFTADIHTLMLFPAVNPNRSIVNDILLVQVLEVTTDEAVPLHKTRSSL